MTAAYPNVMFVVWVPTEDLVVGEHVSAALDADLAWTNTSRLATFNYVHLLCQEHVLCLHGELVFVHMCISGDTSGGVVVRGSASAPEGRPVRCLVHDPDR